MRLIDADDVLDSIENWKKIVLYYHPYTKKFSTIPMSEVLSFLEDSPTIDAAPVNHGEWSTYDVSGYRKCSMCGGYVNWNPKPFLFGDGEYNYCPNCGARMDGGKDDAEE